MESTNGWIYLVSNVRCLKKSEGFEAQGGPLSTERKEREKVAQWPAHTAPVSDNLRFLSAVPFFGHCISCP